MSQYSINCKPPTFLTAPVARNHKPTHKSRGAHLPDGYITYSKILYYNWRAPISHAMVGSSSSSVPGTDGTLNLGQV